MNLNGLRKMKKKAEAVPLPDDDEDL